MPIISDSSYVLFLCYHSTINTNKAPPRDCGELAEGVLMWVYATFSELVALSFRVPPKV